MGADRALSEVFLTNELLLKKLCLLLAVSVVLAGCAADGSTASIAESVSRLGANCGSDKRVGHGSGDYVCAHNAARAAAEPAPASALPKLTWNANLAAVAQAYAKRCTWAHNANRTNQYVARSGERAVVGENLFMSTYPTVTAYDAVAWWASEAAFYNYKKNSCAAGEVCGHYTQLVWRGTRQVGCGSAFCAKVANSTLTNATVVVCDYTPAGNYVGERPY
jgi:pathogenesis-related protein 1